MSTMPKRYAGVLASEQMHERLEVLAAAERNDAQTRGKRSLIWIGLGALALALMILVLDARADRRSPASSAPFGPGAVVSAQLAGVGTHPSDFTPRTTGLTNTAPPPPTIPASPPVSPPVTDPDDKLTPREFLASIEGPRRTSPPARRTNKPRLVDLPFPDDVRDDPEKDATELRQALNALLTNPTEPQQPQPPSTPKQIVPVGTRVPVRLLAPTTTSLTGGPTSAIVTADVTINGTTLIPAGTQIIGDAYATPESDRAHIVWKALVIDNTRTFQLQAACLAVDNEVGLPAKLVRKGSRKKQGLGRFLGSVGSALSFGLIGSGSSGLAQRTASAATTRVGDSLENVEQEWEISDKGLRVEANTPAIVFLRSNLELK